MADTLKALKEANAAWAKALREKAPLEVIESLDEARQVASSAHAMWLAKNI